MSVIQTLLSYIVLLHRKRTDCSWNVAWCVWTPIYHAETFVWSDVSDHCRVTQMRPAHGFAASRLQITLINTRRIQLVAWW